MNYYEELGISRSASPAEIQQAYKALVRIIHPDQQQDEKLRRLSELQLVRLNLVMSELSDPEKRREYDRTLDRHLPVIRPAIYALSDLKGVRVHVRVDPTVFVWLMIAAILGVTFAFWLRQPSLAEARMQVAAEERRARPASIVMPVEPAAPEPLLARPIVSEPIKPVEAPPSVQPKPAPFPLAGRWVYAPDGRDPRIELQMQNRAGLLHGKYRATYPDSEVNFQFAGRTGGPVSLLPWSSSYGSRGEVRLKRLTDKTLEVTWITTDLPRGDAPASGKAILSRSSQ